MKLAFLFLCLLYLCAPSVAKRGDKGKMAAVNKRRYSDIEEMKNDMLHFHNNGRRRVSRGDVHRQPPPKTPLRKLVSNTNSHAFYNHPSLLRVGTQILNVLLKQKPTSASLIWVLSRALLRPICSHLSQKILDLGQVLNGAYHFVKMHIYNRGNSIYVFTFL